MHRTTDPTRRASVHPAPSGLVRLKVLSKWVDAVTDHDAIGQSQPSPGWYPHPPGTPVTRQVDGLAIASMVLGILWLYWIGSILAIIFGAIAIKRINASNGHRTGKGMAIAGLILGIVGAVFLALTVLVIAALGVTTEQGDAEACAIERRTVETAVEAYYAQLHTSPPTIDDLVDEGILAEPPPNFTVSAGVVMALPNGRC